MKKRIQCQFPECTKTCAPSRLFCSGHWHALPDEVQAGLKAHWKEHRKWNPEIVCIALGAARTK